MKKLIAIAALISASFAADAQTATATQTTKLTLANAIAITFVNGGATGGDVNLNFNNVNDYANGVISDEQQLLVQSNKRFSVSVTSSTQNFTYSGSASPAPVLAVVNVLEMMVTTNNTGGILTYSNYSAIPSAGGNIISWAPPGGNRTFGVKYRANPGFSLPGGTYTANIVYTATQP